MKQIELNTGTLLVVAVPNDEDPKEFLVGLFPDGFQLLGHPSEITGEVWGKVVETIDGWSGALKEDLTLSGLSLCAANGIKETDVLLFKSKNSSYVCNKRMAGI